METFRITTTVDERGSVLWLSGEIDLAVAPEIVEVGTACLTDDATQTIIDLGHVTFMDSTAIAALIRLRNRAYALDKELVLCHVPERVHKLLVLIALDEVFVEEQDGQCRDSGANGTACQLQYGHRGKHAAAVDNAYWTWDDTDSYRWSTQTPPQRR
jgi:anti-sigma B factor antagonist